MMMLNMDPPEHTKLRKIVNKGFTPRMIRALQDHLEHEAATIVDDIIERGECDFVPEVASELPLIAIAEFLGVPREERKVDLRPVEPPHRLRRPRVPDVTRGCDSPRRWSSTPSPRAWPPTAARTRRTTSSARCCTPRSTASASPTSSSTCSSSCSPSPATRRPATPSPTACTRSSSTPTSTSASWRIPSLIDSAVEEILRWSTPVMNFRRTTTTDAVLGGVDIPAGAPVVFWHMSANRDETRVRRSVRLRHHPRPEPAHAARRVRRRRPSLLPRREPRPRRDQGDVRGASRSASPRWSSPARCAASARTSSTASRRCGSSSPTAGRRDRAVLEAIRRPRSGRSLSASSPATAASTTRSVCACCS